MTNRRRFLAISAAAIAMPRIGNAAPIHTWQGVALGARATLRLAHPDATAISQRVAAEISRLEDIFSLYRNDSSLSQLNRLGSLQAPPFELLECLSLAGVVHQATDGRFDPTIQPLWRSYVNASITESAPDTDALNEARALIGLEHVTFDSTEIRLRSGMEMSLNGIAQGYIADRVAEMLSAEGLTDILVNTGEFRAIGAHPNGGAWPVGLAAGGEVPLVARSLATSAPMGTTFDELGTIGHILDPRTGVPTQTNWQEISVSARSAALADALSTAACLFESRAEIELCLENFKDVRLEAAIAA